MPVSLFLGRPCADTGSVRQIALAKSAHFGSSSLVATGERKGPRRARDDLFSTTHWSVVLRAGATGSAQATQALEQLCRSYWRPLCVFVLRQGHASHDAQDLTQAFFARFLAGNNIAQADREKGRFRSFLLASLKHFLANEWDRAHALKRGGHSTFTPWADSGPDAEASLALASPELDPEAAYERQWALTLLEQVFTRLGEECAAAGKRELFDTLRPCLSGEKSDAPYAALAASLRMTPGAVQVAVHRLRQRYGQLLRAEIAHTVGRAADVDDELRHLFAILRR